MKLKLLRGTFFLNDTNCMDKANSVTIQPPDRASIAVGTNDD